MTNVKDQKPIETQSPNEKVYDLEDRTARHGEDIIEFVKSIEKDE